jgi:hypothetical protein
MQAIEAQRLRVNVSTGEAFYRRPHPKAIWRPCKVEWVHPPGRPEKPYARVSFTGLRCLLHRLVWYAAHGEIPNGMELNHQDGDKANNRAENLELVTSTRNHEHAREEGLWEPKRGFRSHRAKLADEQVAEIRASRQKHRELAERYGVSQSQISRIRSGKIYRPLA